MRTNNTNAITIDTSQNATFGGTINSGAITSTAGISGTTGTFTGEYIYLGGRHGIKSQSNDWLYITDENGSSYTAGVSRIAGTECYWNDKVTSDKYYNTSASAGNYSMSLDSSRNVIFGGNVLPSADNSKDLGSASLRWANIYSADVHLSNEGSGGNEVDGTEGNWTIQEGEEDLYLLNNKTGKKYKFALQEIK